MFSPRGFRSRCMGSRFSFVHRRGDAAAPLRSLDGNRFMSEPVLQRDGTCSTSAVDTVALLCSRLEPHHVLLAATCIRCIRFCRERCSRCIIASRSAGRNACSFRAGDLLPTAVHNEGGVNSGGWRQEKRERERERGRAPAEGILISAAAKLFIRA